MTDVSARWLSGVLVMSPINAYQTLIPSAALAKELGVHINTLCRWTRQDRRFRQCLFRRGWFSVQRLREAGILANPVQEAHS